MTPGNVGAVNGTSLIRPPSSRLAEGIVTHLGRTAVDVALARIQPAAYADALTASGLAGRPARPTPAAPPPPAPGGGGGGGGGRPPGRRGPPPPGFGFSSRTPWWSA